MQIKTSPKPSANKSPETSASAISALEAKAIRHETPCGDSAMIWREWGAGQTLILLHGGGGSWRHWFHTIPALSAYYRLIVADMPGYGDSALPAEPVSFESLGAILAHGVDNLVPPGEPYHIAGFSLGSFIAPHVIKAGRLQAASLALVHGHFIGRMEYSPQGRLQRWRDVTDLEQRREILRNNLGQLMLAHPQSADEGTVDLYREDLERARLRVPGFIDTLDTSILASIQAKICSISGSLDPTASPSVESQAEALQALRPDAETHIISDSGHWVMHEAPEAFNALLASWLDRSANRRDR